MYIVPSVPAAPLTLEFDASDVLLECWKSIERNLLHSNYNTITEREATLRLFDPGMTQRTNAIGLYQGQVLPDSSFDIGLMAARRRANSTAARFEGSR